MSTEIYDVSVIYLSYIPYGISHLTNFLNSYKLYDSGYAHTLIIVFKGSRDENETEGFIQILNEYKLPYSLLYYDGEGFDINAYRWAAGQLQSDYLFFLNTASILLANNWLVIYIRQLSSDIGIIGATSSWQSYYNSVFAINRFSWERNKTIMWNYRKYKLFTKAFFYWRFLFPAFPNPHIRTNAFIVKRIDYLSVKAEQINTKFRSYLYESGKNSLTNQFLKKGLAVLLIDKYGKTYQINEWKSSNTFWNSEQENLLVSDNQTTVYQMATPDEKERMRKLAWG